MICEFQRLPDGRWRCPDCGYETNKAYLEPPKKNCGNPTPRPPGVGTILTHKLRLAKLANQLVFFWQGCKCAQHARQMNAWGPDGCRENADTIISWLMEAPLAKIVPGAREKAEELLREAIEEASHHIQERTDR